jgi:hypothetical protein
MSVIASDLFGIQGGTQEIVKGILSVFDRIVPDKTKAAELKTALLQKQMDNDLAELDAVTKQFLAQRDIIVAEANSQFKLAAIWRPLTALGMGSIPVFYYVIAPIINVFLMPFTLQLILAPLPAAVWNVIGGCLGGYIGSRGVEKTAATVMEGLSKIRIGKIEEAK